MEILFHYYGIDWLMFLAIALHLWMLGNRFKSGFLVGMFACVLGVIFGLLIESIATLMMNVAFFFMHVRAFF